LKRKTFVKETTINIYLYLVVFMER